MDAGQCSGGQAHGVCYQTANGVDLYNGTITGDKAATINANTGASANHAGPSVIQPASFMGGQGAKAGSIAYSDNGSTPTLKAVPSGGNTVPDVVYAIEGNGARPSHEGTGVSETGKIFTLNATEHHAVCYGIDCRNATLDKEKTHTIQAKDSGGISLNCTPSICYRQTGYAGYDEGIGTLRRSGGDMGGVRKASLLSLYENHRKDARYTGPLDHFPTVTAHYGTGGNNTPLIVEEQNE